MLVRNAFVLAVGMAEKPPNVGKVAMNMRGYRGGKIESCHPHIRMGFCGKLHIHNFHGVAIRIVVEGMAEGTQHRHSHDGNMKYSIIILSIHS